MATEYNVFTRHELTETINRITQRTVDIESKAGKFPRLKIIVKNYKKPKTNPQHRAYWRCVGELKKAFYEQGYIFNENDIHQYIKAKAGFTRVIDGVMVTRSTSDLSEDATSEWLKHLIDFMIQFAAENLDYQIKVGDDV